MKGTITAAVAFFVVAIAFAVEGPPPDDFPIAELQYRDGSCFFHLHSRYGFVASWEDGKSSFYLYDKGRTNITVTGDFATFMGELSRFSDGAEVSWVNTCAAPLHYGMPTKMMSEIQKLLKKKDSRWPASSRTILFFVRAVPQIWSFSRRRIRRRKGPAERCCGREPAKQCQRQIERHRRQVPVGSFCDLDA